MSPLAALTVCLLLSILSGCTCRESAGLPAADRSDGVLPGATVPRVADGRIRIDGRLDEAAWDEAGRTGAFVHPADGTPAPGSRVGAAARLLWSERALLVAVTVHEPDPTSPFGRDDVDPHLWERASGVELMVQPGDPGDNRDYYEIQVDVNGAVWDTRFDDYNRPITGAGALRRFGHQGWRSELERAVRVDGEEGRYTVEMALPWSSIESDRAEVPPEPGDVWRVNLYSFRDGQRDSMAWSPILGEGNFHRASRFGRLTFAE